MAFGVYQRLYLLFRCSLLGRALEAVYMFFSTQWKQSGVLEKLYKQDASWLEQSWSYKLAFLPAQLLEWAQRFAPSVNSAISGSFFLKVCAGIARCFITGSSHFWIGALCAGAAGYAVAAFTIGKMTFLLLAVAIVAAVSLVVTKNVSLAAWCGESFAVRFICRAIGIDVDFPWFANELPDSRYAKVLGAVVGGVVGIASAFVSPVLAVAAAFGGMFAFVVLMHPRVGVFAAAALAPFVPTMALVCLTLLSLFSLAVQSICQPDFKWLRDGIGACIVLMLIALKISVIMSMAFSGSLKVWMIYMAFMLFFFVVTNTIKTRALVEALIKTCVISGILVAAYGVLQYTLGLNTTNAWIDEKMFDLETMRVYSTLDNPNVLGEYLLLILPLCAAVFLTTRKLLPKLMYGLGFLGVLYCLVLTQSRGCYLGFALSAAVFVTSVCGRLWWLLLVVLPFVPALLPSTVMQRLTSIGNLEDTSTSYRVFIWFGALAMLRNFWHIGIGMGEQAFNAVYPFYAYHAVVAPHSHNLFLQFMTEAGIPGIFTFLALILAYLHMLFKSARDSQRGGWNYTIAAAVGAGLIGFLLQSMFDYTFYNYRVMLFFWIFLAVGRAAKEAGDQVEA